MELKEKYGRLTVIGQPERVRNNYRVKVRCDCGTENYVYVHNLKTGKTTSCGCWKAEISAERLKKQYADDARERTERIEAEQRTKKLQEDIKYIAGNSNTIDKITGHVMDEIGDVAKQIIAEASQEHWRKCKPLKELLDDGFMPPYIYNRDTKPFFDEYKRIEKEVEEEKERLKSMWIKISSRAYEKGKDAMLRAELASEPLFARVQARSLLVALRKLYTDCGGEIAQRLVAPLQTVQQSLQSWLEVNRRERGSAGVVLPPTSVPLDSTVVAI